MMVRLPRWFVSSIALLFVLNPAVSGLLAFENYTNVIWPFIAIIFYLAAGLISIVYYRQLLLPKSLALFNLIIVVAVPQLVNGALDLSARGSHATWYVTGIGALMCITAYRKRIVSAWIGTGILLIQVLLWGGVNFFWNSGMVGAIGLVAAGHAISLGLSKAEKDTEKYLNLAKASQSQSAAESIIRSERSSRINRTLQGSRPMLEKIATSELNDSEKAQARLLEAELRDEIRGRTILNDSLRKAVRAARERSVEVTILDEGGFESLGEEEANSIRNRLAHELDAIQQGRVTIRSPHQEQHRVTFVASRPGTAKPDVWLKL
jgi:hypothetical protein